MRVLVADAGGREHALAWRLSREPGVTALFCAPGNAGIAPIADLVPMVFAKGFMARHGIPTARYQVCASSAEARDVIAIDRAYQAVSAISFKGRQYRRDRGRKAL